MEWSGQWNGMNKGMELCDLVLQITRLFWAIFVFHLFILAFNPLVITSIYVGYELHALLRPMLELTRVVLKLFKAVRRWCSF